MQTFLSTTSSSKIHGLHMQCVKNCLLFLVLNLPLVSFISSPLLLVLKEKGKIHFLLMFRSGIVLPVLCLPQLFLFPIW